MIFNYSKLRGRIREKLGSEKEYGKQMGFSSYTLSKRLINELPFNAPEIYKSCILLGIPLVDVKPYFWVIYVAMALVYSYVHKAIKQNVDEEGWVTCRTLTNGGEQDVKFISEGNVHRLIVAASKQSKNKEIQNKAKKYASWIFDEIVPSVRANGYYAIPGIQVPDFRDIPLDALASYQRIQRTVMKDLGKSPKEIATEFKKVSLQFGINLSDNFDQLAFEQESLF